MRCQDKFDRVVGGTAGERSLGPTGLAGACVYRLVFLKMIIKRNISDLVFSYKYDSMSTWGLIFILLMLFSFFFIFGALNNIGVTLWYSLIIILPLIYILIAKAVNEDQVWLKKNELIILSTPIPTFRSKRQFPVGEIKSSVRIETSSRYGRNYYLGLYLKNGEKIRIISTVNELEAQELVDLTNKALRNI